MKSILLNLAVSQWQGSGTQISVRQGISAREVVVDAVNGLVERIEPSVRMDRAQWADSLTETALATFIRLGFFHASVRHAEGSLPSFLDGLRSWKMNSPVTTTLCDLPLAPRSLLRGLRKVYDGDFGFQVSPDEKGSRHVVRAQAVSVDRPNEREEKAYLFGLDLFFEEGYLGIHVDSGFVYPRSPSHWKEFLDPGDEDSPLMSTLSVYRYFDLGAKYPFDELWIKGCLSFFGDRESCDPHPTTRISLERPLSVGKGAVPPYRLNGAYFCDDFSGDTDLNIFEESDAASIRRVARHLGKHVASFSEAGRLFSEE